MRRTKTLKLARRMIRYDVTYDASKHNFMPVITAAIIRIFIEEEIKI